MNKKSIYRIRFTNQGTIYEVYAKRVSDAELFGFIEVEELIFGETSAVVVDPSEERLKADFNGVKCTYIPLQAIIRIDVVEKEGVAKVINLAAEGSNIASFPIDAYAAGRKAKKPEDFE